MSVTFMRLGEARGKASGKANATETIIKEAAAGLITLFVFEPTSSRTRSDSSILQNMAKGPRKTLLGFNGARAEIAVSIFNKAIQLKNLLYFQQH